MITKFKLYEKFKNHMKLKNIEDDFNQFFKVGDLVICINNKGTEHILKIGEKYLVVSLLKSQKLIRIRNLENNIEKNCFRKRFIHEEDLNDWQLYTDVKNFNL